MSDSQGREKEASPPQAAASLVTTEGAAAGRESDKLRDGESSETTGRPAEGEGEAAAVEPATKSDGDKGEEEEEEEEKCGFCRFMKGGPCKAVFVEWEKCVDKAREKEQDFVDSCLDKTKALKECLEAHPDYYAPVLDPPEGDGEDGSEQGAEAGEIVSEEDSTAQETAAEPAVKVD